MGVREFEAGIRIFENIKDHVSIAPEEKRKMIGSLDNKLLRGVAISKPDYLENSSFAFGYIQDKEAARRFVRIAAHCNNKNLNLVAIVNTDYFNPDNIDDNFKNHLIGAGFTKIQIEIKGEIKELTLQDQRGTEKILTLINFSGTTPEDKLRYLALSNAVAGSGDTSISEVISTGLTGTQKNELPPLPFMQCPHTFHKNAFLDQMIDEIKKYSEIEGVDCNALIDYMKNMIGKFQLKYSDDEFITFCENINKNGRQIRSSWGGFCHYLNQKRNEHHHFEDMTMHLLLQSLLRSNKSQECIDLFKALKSPNLNGDTLLHDAVTINDIKAIEVMLKDSLYNVDVEHLYNRFTPLHAACFTGNLAAATKLVEYGANINKSDSYGRTPLMLAYLQGHKEAVYFLLNNNCDVNIPNNMGNTVLHYAIERLDIELVRQLLKNATISFDKINNSGNKVIDLLIKNISNIRPSDASIWVSLAIKIHFEPNQSMLSDGKATSIREIKDKLIYECLNHYRAVMNKSTESLIAIFPRLISNHHNNDLCHVLNLISNLKSRTSLDELNSQLIGLANEAKFLNLKPELAAILLYHIELYNNTLKQRERP